MNNRIGRLRGSNGLWLDEDDEKVDGLVRDVFGLPTADPALWVGKGLGESFPLLAGGGLRMDACRPWPHQERVGS